MLTLWSVFTVMIFTLRETLLLLNLDHLDKKCQVCLEAMLAPKCSVAQLCTVDPNLYTGSQYVPRPNISEAWLKMKEEMASMISVILPQRAFLLLLQFLGFISSISSSCHFHKPGLKSVPQCFTCYLKGPLFR